MHKYIYPVIACGLLSGCFMGGSNIKDISSFQKQPLVKASIMPSEAQLNGAKTRVIVMDIDDDNVSVAKNAKLGTAISNKIENLLSDTGVEVVDRKLASKLQKEIQLAELKGRHDYKGPEVADFSVTGKIITANFTQTYYAAKSSVDDKGNRYYTPPSCSYAISIEATLKVHALPSLNLIDTITITDTKSKSQELSNHGYSHYNSIHQCPPYNKAQLESLVDAAGSDAVYESKVKLKNNFAPRGYITDYRVNDGKNIFKITMGKLAGVKEGQEVDIIQTFKNEDQLTGKTNFEERKLVDGSVSNQIGKKYAWIVIDDVEKAKRVHLGDTVKVHFKDSILDEVKKLF
ncbi:MAG: hypothetical protein GXP11_01300 [Gammaproteobacteria bacterium]|nr:hypothetical protein [Gammaproteobacteria bacterium]